MSATQAVDPWQDGVDGTDWSSIGSELDAVCCAVTGQLLTPEEAGAIAGLYSDAARFRSKVNMSRHRFGEGEDRYFAQPYPEAVVALKRALYPRLLPIARD